MLPGVVRKLQTRVEQTNTLGSDAREETAVSDRTETRDVALEIKFRIWPMNRVEFLQTVESLVSATFSDPKVGAVGCFEQLGSENSFLWRECWPSEAEFEGRLEAPTIRTLMGAIGVLGELDACEILRPGWRATGAKGMRAARS